MESNQFSKKSLTELVRIYFVFWGEEQLYLVLRRGEKSENLVSVRMGKPQQLGKFRRRKYDSCTRL